MNPPGPGGPNDVRKGIKQEAAMSATLRLFDRVRLVTERFAEVGAPEHALGYVIGIDGDDGFVVEVVIPGGDGAVATVIAGPGDLRRAEP
jgi:hypothetical protein